MHKCTCPNRAYDILVVSICTASSMLLTKYKMHMQLNYCNLNLNALAYRVVVYVHVSGTLPLSIDATLLCFVYSDFDINRWCVCVCVLDGL